MDIFPIVMAGGSGTRLWPLSRKNFPKQFLKLQGEYSLLQQTMSRVNQLPHEQTLIVSNQDHYFLCQEQLGEFNEKINYLLEPCARNTAPAMAFAAFYLQQHASPDALMLVLPSDHWFGDEKAWCEDMNKGLKVAFEESAIVTFGIKPDSPKTGYGYIEAGEPSIHGAFNVQCFREKPDTQTAQSFVESGRFYWNSGMFACKASVYLTELEKHAPDIFKICKLAFDKGYVANDFLRLDQQVLSDCRSESVDYAVMEKTQKALVLPIDVSWSDLGCWTAVAEANQLDENGNALSGQVMVKDSKDCLISSDHALVTTLGIENQIIVATQDAVLVADKKYSQQVKDIVNSLGERHSQLADDHMKVSRPWGYYEVLAEGETFKVKRLMVKSGATLSLQRHQHRAEHWVVVSGIATVINGDTSLELKANQSTYIPKKTMHRLANKSACDLFVIEVQSGDYLGEDDIERFDDAYHRVAQKT